MATLHVVNNIKDEDGDHEVHAEGCHVFPTKDTTELGDHDNCEDAVKEAKKIHSPVNGCIHCCIDCHTS